MPRKTQKAGIYAILQKGTSRHYVGSSLDVSARWSAHRHMLRKGAHHSPHLQRAWDRYGQDAFEFVLLEKVDDPALLVERESWWIAEKGAADPKAGFNVGPVAGSRAGVPHSEQSRAAISAAMRGRRLSAEHREKIGAANLGKRRSEDERARISAMTASRHVAGQGPGAASRFFKGGPNPFAGRTMSEEQKAKLREKARVRMADPEFKAKWLAARRKRGGPGMEAV